MYQFAADTANGDLPAYAFIEPRMVFNHNDMHPPFGTMRESDVDEDGSPDRRGQQCAVGCPRG